MLFFYPSTLEAHLMVQFLHDLLASSLTALTCRLATSGWRVGESKSKCRFHKCSKRSIESFIACPYILASSGCYKVFFPLNICASLRAFKIYHRDYHLETWYTEPCSISIQKPVRFSGSSYIVPVFGHGQSQVDSHPTQVTLQVVFCSKLKSFGKVNIHFYHNELHPQCCWRDSIFQATSADIEPLHL